MATILSQTRQKATSKQFTERLPFLREVHATALADVLPGVLADARSKDEEEEVDDELAEWLEDWLNDLGQLFRIAKKQDFDRRKTLDAVKRTMEWRLHNLSHLPPPRPCSFLRFLPHPLTSNRSAEDTTISTQPILLLSLQNLSKHANATTLTNEEKLEEVKNIFMTIYELARMYMRDLDCILQERQRELDDGETERWRILQFTLMVDVQNAGMMPNLGKEIVTWWTRELAPNYPGVCNAVYVINYSWAYSAMWAVIKRILPERVLSRILFPSKAELVDHFPPECLLKEYGGSILSLPPDQDEVLERYNNTLSPCDSSSTDSGSSASTITPHNAARLSVSAETIVPARKEPPPPPTKISSFSPSNPFYGYPAIIYHTLLPDGSLSSVPQLLHGRRRKRDFIRTLVLLYLFKFRRQFEGYIHLLVRGLKRSQLFLFKGWHIAKLMIKALDLGRLVAGKVPVGLALALTFGAILLRLRRAMRSGNSQGSLTLSRQEVSWLRQVMLIALGVSTASLSALPPAPSLAGVI